MVIKVLPLGAGQDVGRSCLIATMGGMQTPSEVVKHSHCDCRSALQSFAFPALLCSDVDSYLSLSFSTDYIFSEWVKCGKNASEKWEILRYKKFCFLMFNWLLFFFMGYFLAHPTAILNVGVNFQSFSHSFFSSRKFSFRSFGFYQFWMSLQFFKFWIYQNIGSSRFFSWPF